LTLSSWERAVGPNVLLATTRPVTYSTLPL
jgi:hypothetical protein